MWFVSSNKNEGNSNKVLKTTTPTSLGIDPIASPTNDNIPKVTGTAEAGSTVEIFDKDESLGNITARGSSFSFIPGTTLSDGQHVIYAQATDEAGNKSPPSDAQTITIDTVPPKICSIEYSPQDELRAGDVLSVILMGVSDGTGITVAGFDVIDATTGIVIDAGIEMEEISAGVYIQVYRYEYTIPSGLVGDYRIIGHLMDAAGNSTSRTARPDVTILDSTNQRGQK